MINYENTCEKLRYHDQAESTYYQFEYYYLKQSLVWMQITSALKKMKFSIYLGHKMEVPKCKHFRSAIVIKIKYFRCSGVSWDSLRIMGL